MAAQKRNPLMTIKAVKTTDIYWIIKKHFTTVNGNKKKYLLESEIYGSCTVHACVACLLSHLTSPF